MCSIRRGDGVLREDKLRVKLNSVCEAADLFAKNVQRL